MASFGLLGCIAAALISPRVIIWYWNPPADMGFNCVKPIQWSLQRFQMAEVGGLIAGLFLGLFVFLALRRRKEPLQHVEEV